MSILSKLIGKIPVVGGAINSVAHNVVDPALRGAVSAVPGGSMALSLGDALGQHIPDPTATGTSLSSLIDPVLGGAAIANAANLSKKSTGYATNAIDTANQSYDSRAPLRTAGVQGMLHPTAGIDLSSLKSIQGRGGPFANKPAGAAPPAPAAAPMPLALPRPTGAA